MTTIAITYNGIVVGYVDWCLMGEESLMKEVDIWVDGSAIRAKGGGFHSGAGVVLIYNGKEKHISHPIEDGSNNIAELTAPTLGLNALTERCKVNIMTDSAYTMNCITKWYQGWVRKNWMTQNKGAVKNKELIQELYAACMKHEVTWIKVKGHSGVYYNDLADELACRASAEVKLKVEGV